MIQKPKTIIVDLDGTIANISHRLHFIDPLINKPTMWKEFYLACSGDTPNIPIIETVKGLKKLGYKIHIFSGRGIIAKGLTLTWLKKHQVPYDRITMRDENDFTDDAELKRKWLITTYPKYIIEILCVIDDRNKVVEMWREMGVVCLQVASGDF